eukprot:13168017-Alexandrium_andersonii.AAC.1
MAPALRLLQLRTQGWPRLPRGPHTTLKTHCSVTASLTCTARVPWHAMVVSLPATTGVFWDGPCRRAGQAATKHAG